MESPSRQLPPIPPEPPDSATLCNVTLPTASGEDGTWSNTYSKHSVTFLDEKQNGGSGMRRFSAIALILALTSSASMACTRTTALAQTVRVPQDSPTIQTAVNKVGAGGVVLVSPGTYRESILIDRDKVTVRGVDRNAVIIDGEYTRQNGFTVAADGVSIENLTIRGFNGNGIFFNGAYSPDGVDPTKNYGQGNDVLKGYRASYVTTYNNGLYGIYAFAARGGQIDHSYASGHPDSGFYVGQCKPCNAVLTDLIAERNAIGYFGTNASGGVYVINSVFRGNRIGITPNSQKMERLAPQSETVVAGNLIVDNDDPLTPAHPQGAFGEGIVVGGGTKNLVTKNRVSGNPAAGILIIDLDGYRPENNRVDGNILTSNGVDLYYSATDGKTLGNCFVGNTFASSSPTNIDESMGCASTPVSVSAQAFRPISAPKGISYKAVPPPAPQPNMPDAATAPATPPLTDVAPKVDLSSIVVPSAA